MRYRSALVSLLAIFAMLLTGVAAVAAQDATPGAALTADELGLPELLVTATDTGFENLPEELEAGRYLVTLTNESSMEVAIQFLQLPEGVTAADLTGGPPGPDATPGPGMASPEAEASPAAEGGEGLPPAWYYETYMAGGPGAPAGETVQGIVDLMPGDYVAWADDPEAPQAPVELTVTGEEGATPAAMADVEADVTVTEVKTGEGYAFEFSGELTTGQQLIEITNDSDQPHFMLLLRSPGPITLEQLFMLLTLPEDATPPADMPNPEEFSVAAYASTQSAGTTQYLAADLEPGYYIIACFVPDAAKGGIPHAAEGMVDIIPVGVEATPTS